MKVQDTMAKTNRCATPHDTIEQVAQMMQMENTGFTPVVEGDHRVGVVTDRDIVIRCLAEGHDHPGRELVSRVMTAAVETIASHADLQLTGERMAQDEIRRLAVVANGKLVGVLCLGNLIQATRAHRPTHEAVAGVTRGPKLHRTCRTIPCMEGERCAAL
jgi:CBS domain-containing protein